MFNPNSMQIFLRLLLSVFLGGVIGLEREGHNQPAGFRTHIVLCIGSCLLMMCGLYIGNQTAQTDPSRIAAQVISGIGFLGAGAIIRLGTSVRGLTTATCLWAVAGIGLAVGSGFYLPAIMTTLIMFIVLHSFDYLAAFLLKGCGEKHILLVLQPSPGVVGIVEGLLEGIGCRIRNVAASRRGNEDLEIDLFVHFPPGMKNEEIISKISQLDVVKEVEII